MFASVRTASRMLIVSPGLAAVIAAAIVVKTQLLAQKPATAQQPEWAGDRSKGSGDIGRRPFCTHVVSPRNGLGGNLPSGTKARRPHVSPHNYSNRVLKKAGLSTVCLYGP